MGPEPQEILPPPVEVRSSGTPLNPATSRTKSFVLALFAVLSLSVGLLGVFDIVATKFLVDVFPQFCHSGDIGIAAYTNCHFPAFSLSSAFVFFPLLPITFLCLAGIPIAIFIIARGSRAPRRIGSIVAVSIILLSLYVIVTRVTFFPRVSFSEPIMTAAVVQEWESGAQREIDYFYSDIQGESVIGSARVPNGSFMPSAVARSEDDQVDDHPWLFTYDEITGHFYAYDLGPFRVERRPVVAVYGYCEFVGNSSSRQYEYADVWWSIGDGNVYCGSRSYPIFNDSLTFVPLFTFQSELWEPRTVLGAVSGAYLYNHTWPYVAENVRTDALVVHMLDVTSPARFDAYVDGAFATDGESVYLRGVWLPGADAASFRMISRECGADAARTYWISGGVTRTKTVLREYSEYRQLTVGEFVPRGDTAWSGEGFVQECPASALPER